MILNPKKAILLNSIVLIVIGSFAYYIKSSPTALIPVFFGALIGVCYFTYDMNNKIVAHVCLVLMLLIVMSLFMPLKARIASSDSAGVMRIIAMQLVTLYSIICFIVSFINARKTNN
tara:strand:+ start:1912 stop:2262 length:351 start_codon:yes stop_codon:yes gene_type:complete